MRTVDQIASEIVDSAIAVHRALGPGLLESAYEACLAYELRSRGLEVEQQKVQPVLYGDLLIDAGYRLDLLVENKVLIELKTLEQVLPVHHAQIITCLKLSKVSVGFLINFHVSLMKNGIRRFVNNFKS
jgi:GxxExxY protein